MESTNAPETVVAISDCNSDLSKSKEDEVNNVNQENSVECGESVIPVNKRDTENKENDDLESVIIEEVENKTIELDADSDAEIELNVEEESGDLPDMTDITTSRITEFVIVNEANSAKVADHVEPMNKYDDIQVKDELAEPVTTDLNTNDVLENDPMDLLELNHRSESSASVRSQDDTDYGDDMSSIGSSSIQTGSSSSTSVLEWIKDYPWLLYDEEDEPLGYCLYCDAKINTKSQRCAKQHGLSLYHKERCENYLAFRQEEEKNGLGMQLVEIKEEFGTDSRVQALKLKRKSQSAALNNFNWRRWLEDCPWLERDTPDGTVGYCKSCRIHVNVEFSYLRDRHGDGVKHREAEKQTDVSHEPAELTKPLKAHEEKDNDSATDSIQSNNQRWLEILKNEPSTVRCKLCGTKMLHNNFLRHLRTNLHEQNEKIYMQNLKVIDEEGTKNKLSWRASTKHHPWMVSDPINPAFGYCKYCKKRIVYGSSSVKRTLHENSSQHKQNEIEFKNRSKNINADKKQTENDADRNHEENDNENPDENKSDGEAEEEADDQNEENEEEGDDEEDNEGENEYNKDDEEEADNEGEERGQEEKDREDCNESRRRFSKLSNEWINQYSWCRKYGKDPTNFIFCIYCRIPLSLAYPRAKHQKTSFHISAEKRFLSRQAKKQRIQDRKQGNETVPFFEWAIPLKNNSSSYSCRYCRVRISKNYSKKQHASSKIHQINESIYKNNRKSLRSDENINTSTSPQTTMKADLQPPNNAPTKKIQTFAKVVIKSPSTVALVKQLQKKFPWLSYKRNELRSHYGHCKICDSSLYIRSMKHVMRHLRSARHINIIKANKRQKVEKTQEFEDEEKSPNLNKTSKDELQPSSPAPTDNSPQNQPKESIPAVASRDIEYQGCHNYKSSIADMKKRFSWIENCDKPNYAYCRFCNSNIPLKILMLKSHSNSQKHRHCVINYYSSDGNKISKNKRDVTNADLYEIDSKSGDAENDVVMLEENNEVILISEQDENWTVKSETMDEHEELDYLLQQSFNIANNPSNIKRNVRQNINTGDTPPAKRMKQSQSFRSLNDSNSSLVASLLTTPLTLASCLGPLIQQQIQQQAKANVPMSSTPEASKTTIISNVESENTFDLFFKSISETMKKLPLDLAAEGKVRVMQIICDLELQALKRQQSERIESMSSNNSSVLNYQSASIPASIQPVCSSSVANDKSAEKNGNGNEGIMTRLNKNKEVSSASNIVSEITIPSGSEKPVTSCATSPIIGVMDKNGLQTLQFKTSVPKPISRNTTTTTITSVTNSGIRCIPFKNLSQTPTPEPTNTKITRIQVPINAPTQSPNSNANAVNSSKNLMNFRNIQITKRIGTPPTSTAPVTATQQTVQKPPTMTTKSPQRTFLTNIQPQLQRWGCSVNGATSLHTPTSSTAHNHHQQLSSHHTSTPISKK